jgi:hypothetical protein
MRFKLHTVVGATLFLSALGLTCPDQVPDRVADGDWGGDHIGMVVSDTGATIEYDCAAGRIVGPLRVAGDGSFAWSGVHYPGHGGPTRIDEPPDAHQATYTGSATTDRLVLTVSLADNSQPPATFVLIRGGLARVFKCL